MREKLCPLHNEELSSKQQTLRPRGESPPHHHTLPNRRHRRDLQSKIENRHSQTLNADFA
ncbi:hypothetical protein Bca4012_043274 [Brassica carinata]